MSGCEITVLFVNQRWDVMAYGEATATLELRRTNGDAPDTYRTASVTVCKDPAIIHTNSCTHPLYEQVIKAVTA